MRHLFLCAALIFSMSCQAGEKFSADPAAEPEFVKLLQAARANDSNAQVELAGIYNFGRRGLLMSTVKAEYWLCRAIHLKSEDAKYKLGVTMSGTLYYAERMQFIRTPGYKHQTCNLDQLAKLDPSLVQDVEAFKAQLSSELASETAKK